MMFPIFEVTRAGDEGCSDDFRSGLCGAKARILEGGHPARAVSSETRNASTIVRMARADWNPRKWPRVVTTSCRSWQARPDGGGTATRMRGRCSRPSSARQKSWAKSARSFVIRVETRDSGTRQFSTRRDLSVEGVLARDKPRVEHGGAVEASSTEPEEGSEETWVAGEVTGRQRYGPSGAEREDNAPSHDEGPAEAGCARRETGHSIGERTAQA